MPINNRGLSGQPILPYIDYRSYMGADVFVDLTFLDHTGNPVNPQSVTYRLDDLTNAVPMIASTNLFVTKSAGTGSVGLQGSASVAADVMTIQTITSGILLPGDTVTLAGLPAGTTVLSQLTGTTGGIGTYRLSYPSLNPISTTTLTTASYYVYVTSMTYGVFAPADLLVNSQWSATIEALATNPNPTQLTGTLWLLAGSQLGPFQGLLSVTSSLPSSYTLQIPGSLLQMTHNWQGSQICQLWLTTTWVDPVTNQLATAQGVAVIELLAIQTPNGAL
jgi:hypothetical protein